MSAVMLSSTKEICTEHGGYTHTREYVTALFLKEEKDFYQEVETFDENVKPKHNEWWWVILQNTR